MVYTQDIAIASYMHIHWPRLMYTCIAVYIYSHYNYVASKFKMHVLKDEAI